MIRVAAEVPIMDDPLTYLPRRGIQEFGKGRLIYCRHQPSDRMYVVVLGRVKVTSTANDGIETIGRIVCTEGLFGEGALVGGRASESAMALDTASVMSWTRNEIEQYVEREPRLGIALTQHLVRQCLALQDRIESMAVQKTPERVTVALAQLARMLGAPLPDGTTRIASLTHRTIAEYVGTSREIVTFQMNRLRRLGMIRYTRLYIDVYTEAIEDALRQQGITVPRDAGAAVRQAAPPLY